MHWGMRVRPFVSVLLVGSLLVLAAPAGADLFLPPVAVPAGDLVEDILSADFNGDGFADLLVLAETFGQPFDQPPPRWRVYLNQRDGTFGPPIDTEAQSTLISVGDLDGDGRADVILGGAHTTILWGDGDGRFTLSSPVDTGDPRFLQSAIVADVNGDGRPDLVFPEYEGNHVVVVFAGPPTSGPASRPVFGNPVLLTIAGECRAVRVADMDGDGTADIVVLSGATTPAFTVQVFHGIGNGQFVPGPSLALGDRDARSLEVGDLTGDGRPDIVTANHFTNTLTVIRNGPTGLSLAFDSAFVELPFRTRLADVNGDGLLDVIAATYDSASVAVALGNGDGTLRPPRTYAAASLNGSLVVADFDHDGTLDVASGGGSSSVAVLRHAPALHLDAGPDQTVASAGATEVTLSASVVYSDPAVTLRWREGRHMLGTGPVLVLPVSIGQRVMTVEATASDGAFASDTVKVTGSGSFASQTSVDSLAAKLDGLGIPAQESTAKGLLGDVTNQGILTSALLTFVQGQLDATVGSRASSKDLTAAVVALKTAGVTQANLDGLSAGIGAAVAGARKDLLRAAIECALARGETVVFFMVPAAGGGVLETVRGVVASAIAGLHAPDRATRRAQSLLVRGDAELAAGRAGDAYRDFADAYQAVARP
jgi:FG-GAP-like repeat